MSVVICLYMYGILFHVIIMLFNWIFVVINKVIWTSSVGNTERFLVQCLRINEIILNLQGDARFPKLYLVPN